MLQEGYKYFRWLSLDIVLGAIIFLCFLENYYHLDLSFHIYFALGSAVWLIYTIDHLIDASKSINSNRRAFHHKNSKKLILFGCSVLVLALINVYFLPLEIIKNGAILSALCISYLTLVYFFRQLWVKELMVSFGYTAGILLAPFNYASTLGMDDLLLSIHLFLIASINLLVFSSYDLKQDIGGGFGSIIITLGKKRSKQLINMLIFLSLGLIIYCFQVVDYQNELSWLFLTMTLTLATIFWFPHHFAFKERFRVIGDAVFYFPIFFIW